MTMPAEILSMIISEVIPADLNVFVATHRDLDAYRTRKPTHDKWEWSPAWVPRLMFVSNAFGQILRSVLWTRLMLPLPRKGLGRIRYNSGCVLVDWLNRRLQRAADRHLRRILRDPR